MTLHTVQRGETFYRIAKRYGVSVPELMSANGMRDPSQLAVGQRLIIPTRVYVGPSYVAPSGPYSIADVRRLVGPTSSHKKWKTITVHHSATAKGSAKLFHRDHLRRGMGGLFYHFVIGNGSYSNDGQIEPGFRWKKQKDANRVDDIQICLVGDFSRHEPSAAQLSSLAILIAVLESQNGFRSDHVRRHEDVPGKHTECPGKLFPFQKLLSLVEERRRQAGL